LLIINLPPGRIDFRQECTAVTAEDVAAFASDFSQKPKTLGSARTGNLFNRGSWEE
jgi:hypothetical protein